MNREWTLQAESIIPEGFPEPDGPGALISADDPEELANFLMGVAWLLREVGGTFSIAAGRREIAPGLFVPHVYAANWKSYAPGIRGRNPEQFAEAAQEPPAPPEELTEEEIADHFPPEAEEELPAPEEHVPSVLDGLVGEPA